MEMEINPTRPTLNEAFTRNHARPPGPMVVWEDATGRMVVWEDGCSSPDAQAHDAVGGASGARMLKPMRLSGGREVMCVINQKEKIAMFPLLAF